MKLDEETQKARSSSHLEDSKNIAIDQDSDRDEQVDNRNEPTDIIVERLRKVKIVEVEFDSDDDPLDDDTNDKTDTEIPDVDYDHEIQQVAPVVVPKYISRKDKLVFSDWFTDETLEFINVSNGKPMRDSSKEKWDQLREEVDSQYDKISKFFDPKISNKVRFEVPEKEPVRPH